MIPTTSQHSSRTSSTPTASSLRPRTRRLISGLEEQGELSVNSESNRHLSSPFASPLISRNASPIPSSHPSRIGSSSAIPRSGEASSSRSKTAFGRKTAQNTIGTFWGNPWSTIQGLASNVLGTDTGHSSTDSKSWRRKTRPLEFTHGRSGSRSALPSQWGPSGSEEHIGQGSREERDALVRERKRKDMLAANVHMYADAVGRFKRRNSDERISTSVPPTGHEEDDALVYIHHVKRSDTVAGITIRYNCQAVVLRKANRMWPNDTPQVRKTLVLPVDACAIKGKPVPGPKEAEEDLLLEDNKSTSLEELTPTSTPQMPNGWSTSRHTSQSNINPRPPSSSTSVSNVDSEPPWKHDSWVLLPNDTVPTEIARLPRKSLGFFPPARRKSRTFSDASATPKASMDVSPNPSNVPMITTSPDLPPLQNATSSPARRPGRRRTSSAASIQPSYFLHGPGGVGTMSANVRSPGPAQNNKVENFLAKHLPDVAPPPNQTVFTPWTPGLGDLSEFDTLSGAGQVGSSTAGTGAGVGFDLENVGGAIEGWVRKMATKATKVMEPTGNTQRSGLSVVGLGAGSGIGDLIELTDAFEIGGDEDDEDRRGRTDAVGTARKDIPEGIRGRAKGRGLKSDKGD
ncbi:carbohydrate-binding module family 50 protein [Patellaria atrata CBS 101060]|uniref:Carbohydrate-binding module family 50 protein n=1 Tax=Patellaria atrata CBS 101060 TaxID=1346257 RepID=A0A9P4VP96_9PEZI|nr:carbohydrate-binding module family 50 protein [Patellaria atrata CBS 101060]